MEIKIQTRERAEAGTNPESSAPGQFSGPLDLLLQLIEQQEMDITQIALANVTEQFLSHVRLMEATTDATQLADYLAIAAKLLVIKSKHILPTLEMDREDEEPAMDLEAQLLLYKRFKEAAKLLRRLDNRRRQSFAREANPISLMAERTAFYPDPSINPDVLRENIARVLESLKEIIREPEGIIREVISIQEKIASLQERIASSAQSMLSEMLAEAKSKTEVIVTFLALLELTKQRIVVVTQDTLFSDITISMRTPEISQE